MKNSSDPLAGSLFKRHSLGDLWASQEEKRRRTTAKISRRHLIELPEEQKELEDVRMDLSFSGAGFMGCYYFGVVDCWNKYIPHERVHRVAGTSAGSLIAAYYLMDLPLEQCLREIIGMTEDIRRRSLGVFDRSNQIVDVLPRKLDVMFPEDAHKRVNGRLFVCMTRLKDLKCVVVNEFESKKDLIDALNCSCFIPIWSGNHVSTFRGVKHIDGGFTNNLPLFDEHTIRICCFAGTSDISPTDRAKIDLIEGSLNGMPFHLSWTNARRARRALFPPPASYIIGSLERGFHDTKDFILDNDLIQCDACYGSLQTKSELPIYQRPTPTISPAASPCVSRQASIRLQSLLEAGGGGARSEEEAERENLARLERLDVTPTGGQRSSFRALLRDRLRRVAQRAPAEGPPGGPIQSGRFEAPSIVIEGAEEEVEEVEPAEPKNMTIGDIMGAASATGPARCQTSSPADRKRVSRPLPPALGRRNTVAQLEPDHLMADKFQFAPHPLPSCPPSPSLNRHCNECIRLRQEARLDGIDPTIKREADHYRNLGKEREELGRRSSLGLVVSPIRWLRQLGSKSSYSLCERPRAPLGAPF